MLRTESSRSTSWSADLADTWSRIAPSMSRAWRRRFGRHVQEMNESWVWELPNAAANRIPDPIEYVEMRRRTGGVYWAADLVEHALGIEVPLEIYASRAIGVLNDTMCDSVLLRNDILSYEKEMQEGETNNGVLVAQAFLGCDLQRAFHVVNGIVVGEPPGREHDDAGSRCAAGQVPGPPAARRARIRAGAPGRDGWRLSVGNRHGPLPPRTSGAMAACRQDRRRLGTDRSIGGHDAGGADRRGPSDAAAEDWQSGALVALVRVALRAARRWRAAAIALQPQRGCRAQPRARVGARDGPA